jgi:hypothetical protein
MIEKIPFMLRFSKLLASWNQSSFAKSRVRFRHSRESGNPEPPLYLPLSKGGDKEGVDIRVALAIASLPGMTVELCNELQKHRALGTAFQAG